MAKNRMIMEFFEMYISFLNLVGEIEWYSLKIWNTIYYAELIFKGIWHGLPRTEEMSVLISDAHSRSFGFVGATDANMKWFDWHIRLLSS